MRDHPFLGWLFSACPTRDVLFWILLGLFPGVLVGMALCEWLHC